MIDQSDIKEVPLYMLEPGDRFITRATKAFGQVVELVDGGEEEGSETAAILVNLSYPDGRMMARTVHPGVLVDKEI